MKWLALIFLTALVLTYGPLSLVYDHFNARRVNFIVTEFDSLQTQIEGRFQFYNRSALALTKMAWQQKEVTPQEFSAMGETIVTVYPETIGANFVDPSGLIKKVYPERRNRTALGKRSQNTAALQEAEARNQEIWISPPFILFQGEPGFVYYFAIHKENKLHGWYGIVMSRKLLQESFVGNGQFQNIHMSLRDVETNRSYIETAPLPLDLKHVRTSTFRSFDREFILQSWAKDETLFGTGFPIVALVSVLVATFVTLAMHFFRQRREAHRHVQQVDALLDHVISDTAHSVLAIKSHVELAKSDPRLVPLDRMALHVGFTLELMEQIKVMRGLATLAGDWQQRRQYLLPLVLEVIDIYTDRIREKNLIVDYDPDALAAVMVDVNHRLFVHAVLANVLGTFVRLAPANGTVNVSFANDRLKVTSQDRLARPDSADELSLSIAQKALKIQRGDLELRSLPTYEVDLILPS